ncbi:hypothetical protein CKO51_18005 [Rhodopirellula sp. SM50]|nr:hypothetical protein CKO51_18005 [Rhodopirellula sp. SM50]
MIDVSEIVETWPELRGCTRGVREIAARASCESATRNDVEIRPEHMLIAMIRLAMDGHRCLGAQTFAALQVDLRLFYLGVGKLTKRFGDMCTCWPRPNLDAKRLLENACRHSRSIDEFSISEKGCGTGGLLLAFLDTPGSIPHHGFTVGLGLRRDDLLVTMNVVRKPEP